MKYCFFLFPVAVLAFACGDQKTPAGEVVCEITAPSDGAEAESGQPLRIEGDARSANGDIVKVRLTVDGQTVGDVTGVPFKYDYHFISDRKPGRLTLGLWAEDERGFTGTASVTVTVVGPQEPEGPRTGIVTDPRDGNRYRTVTLDGRTWMAENLRYFPAQHYDVSADEPRYYVMFDHDAAEELGKGFLDAYGAFYNLPAALQGEAALQPGENRRVKGVCPEGWHIPSQAEWQRLGGYVLDAGMAAVTEEGTVDTTAVAKALASAAMWILPEYTDGEPRPTWVAVEMEKNNASLFDGLPVGFRACAGDEDWMHQCYSAGWWSSTAAVFMDPSFGVPVRMWSDLQTFVTTAEFHPGVGLPVRCLKD